MIRLECNKGDVKVMLCGSPVHLVAESCVMMNSITKRILRDCPKSVLDRFGDIFIEEIVTSIKDGIDEIKGEESDE